MKENRVCAAAMQDNSGSFALAWLWILVLVLVQLLVIQGLPGVGR